MKSNGDSSSGNNDSTMEMDSAFLVGLLFTITILIVTVYVMRKNGTDITFWNACTGDGFLKNDDLCTLKVATIANEDNVWLNIHEEERISRMNFDLNDSSRWRPFFGHKFVKEDLGNDLGSVQIPDLTYTKPDLEFVEMVQRQIDRTLKDDFREWRTKRKLTTVPQNIVQRELAETLVQMEYEANALEMEGFGFSRFQHRQLMEKHAAKYKVHGFPLNRTFTDVRSIIKMVEACDFHENPLPGVKFAISVKCIGYPNDVISVWVYIATLEPRT